MTHYGVIDIGTNSVRLLIATEENKVLNCRKKYIEMTRLGKGVEQSKMLQEDRMLETIRAIGGYVSLAREMNPDIVLYLFATSAVRDAYNGIDFVKRVLDETGLSVEIVSGDAEAGLGFLGVQQIMQPGYQYLIFDIGGGSTELMIGDIEGLKDAFSIDIGAVRLSGKYIDQDPPNEAMLHKISAYTKEQLLPVVRIFNHYHITHVIGIGGTASSFTTMVHEMPKYDPLMIEQKSTTVAQVNQMNKMMTTMTLAERQRVVGLAPKRADIIIAGGIILENILTAFQQTKYTSTDFDNLEGYLITKIL